MVKKKTSKDSWQASLARVLERTSKVGTASRLAIVGIGNELNGDDAAGVLIVRKLIPFFITSPSIKILEAGQAPENITGAVIRFKPDDILFIDAVSLNAPPGSIHWIDWQRVEGFSASSHSLPLSVVIQYLLHEHACRVHVLGIQVSDTTTGSPVSPEILRSVDSISELILTTLSPV
jgi:hydrogenase 3 maturation protease